jgi:hypothetical protein
MIHFNIILPPPPVSTECSFPSDTPSNVSYPFLDLRRPLNVSSLPVTLIFIFYKIKNETHSVRHLLPLPSLHSRPNLHRMVALPCVLAFLSRLAEYLRTWTAPAAQGFTTRSTRAATFTLAQLGACRKVMDEDNLLTRHGTLPTVCRCGSSVPPSVYRRDAPHFDVFHRPTARHINETCFLITRNNFFIKGGTKHVRRGGPRRDAVPTSRNIRSPS